MVIKALSPSVKHWKQTKYPIRWDCKIEYYAAIKNHIAED